MAASLFARARFMAGLLLQVAGRALPGKARSDETERLIEAILTGELASLNANRQRLVHGENGTGTPWFFIALESGSLAAVEWFLAQGANPTATDRAGRLPLEAVIERAALADDFDDHLPDCPAMAQTLIAAGATPAARNRTGLRLADLAASAGLALG